MQSVADELRGSPAGASIGNGDIGPASAPCSLRDAAKIEEGTASRSDAAAAPSTESSWGIAGGGPCWVGSPRVRLLDQAGRKPSAGALRDTLTRGPAHQQCVNEILEPYIMHSDTSQSGNSAESLCKKTHESILASG